MENYTRVHLIEVKKLGATNTKGSRVKFTSLRFGDSVTISYDYARDNISDMFTDWLKSKDNDLGIVSVGYDEKRYVYIFGVKAFEPMKNINNGGVLV
jgi:hypothetical protein